MEVSDDLSTEEPSLIRLLKICRILEKAVGFLGVWVAKQVSLTNNTQNLVDPNTPHVVLEDIIDASPVSECSSLFDQMQNALEVLTDVGPDFRRISVQVLNCVLNSSPSLFTAKTKLALIRICNNLLRRLSKSRDHALAGRVLLFLARVLPLNDKSGQNLRHDFNVDNVTVFDETYACYSTGTGFAFSNCSM